MAQMGKLRLSWVTQLLESQGCEHTQPDTSVCVLGPKAGAVHLQSTLKPLRAKGRPLGAGCWVQAGLTSQEGKSSSRGLGDVLLWVSCGCRGHHREEQGRGGPWRSPCPAVLRCPREPRGSACLSDEVCGGPGGDWGGSS